MVLGMLLALFAATLARGDASLQKRPGDASVVGRLAAYHSESGGADIGAVPAQSDALDHLGQVLLAQVIVRVSEASLGAQSLSASRAAASTPASRSGCLGECPAAAWHNS